MRMVGMAHVRLEIGVEYVKEREAFGQKIGGFQAIGHRLADCKAAADGAELSPARRPGRPRPMTRRGSASWRRWRSPSHARPLATPATGRCTSTAGYGFMLEYDIQLYYRRSRAWARVVMDPGRAYQRVADRRYGRRPAAGAAVPTMGERAA